MLTFLDDEHGYRFWLLRNPTGFVINSYRSPASGYLKMHRARCSTISKPAVNYTKQYSKTCSAARQELEAWARRIGGSADPCPVCAP
jgi:hypothetical protein